MADQNPPTPPAPPAPPTPPSSPVPQPSGQSFPQSPTPPPPGNIPPPPPPMPGGYGIPPAGDYGAAPYGGGYGSYPPMGGRYGAAPPPPKPAGPPFVFGAHQATFTTTITAPSHPKTTFDEKKFITLLAGSISLTKAEKRRIVESIPKLSQWQIDELIRILEEEKQKFIELSPKHGDQLRKLEEQHLNDWRDLEVEMKSDQRKAEDQAQADEIRRKLLGGGGSA